MIEPAHPELSIVRQCRLVQICRSSYYYEGTRRCFASKLIRSRLKGGRRR